MPDQPFLGEIFMAGFSFAPKNYTTCQGQLLSIQQNTALFSLLGTTYGGNGVQTFALPNLQGRIPIGQGEGQGLTTKTLGESAGYENVTLLQSQLPAHSHNLMAVNALGDTASPTGNMLANTATLDKDYATGANNISALNSNSINAAGGNKPHSNIPPYICINCYIALQGVFPSRS